MALLGSVIEVSLTVQTIIAADVKDLLAARSLQVTGYLVVGNRNILIIISVLSPA